MDEHFTRLTQLPGDVVCPPDLNDRVAFDAKNKRLVFRGFMTNGDYDRLCRLSSDFHYQRALEKLFIAASGESPHGWSRVVWLTLLVAALAATVCAVWHLFHSSTSRSP